MNKLNVIIVDDEIDACEGLQLLLSNQSDISVVSVCRNGKEAVRSINQLKPDLVFLDIQMPGLNGFGVLEELDPESLPSIIFVTAYDEYALNAFEVHAIDYLQKPFTDERFYKALEHAKQRIVSQNNQAVLQLLDSPAPSREILPRLKIKSSKKLFLLDYEEVIWLQGFDYYIKVHTSDRFYLVRESLKTILMRLPSQFVQVHKSSIINTGHLRTLEPRARGTYELTLSNEQRVILSQSYRKNLEAFL